MKRETQELEVKESIQSDDFDTPLEIIQDNDTVAAGVFTDVDTASPLTSVEAGVMLKRA